MTRVPVRLQVAAALVLLLAIPTLLFGHAVVYPKTSTAGAFEKYVLRVPNERDAATTRVEIRFPADVRVTSFADVQGWQLEVLTDTAKRIIGAVWTGTLPPKRFVEFPFVGANPKTAGTLTWPTFQTYANGERVEWTGEAGSKTPASQTAISLTATPTASTATNIDWIPWIALGIAVIALGLSLRRPAATHIT